jgi:hypothetical protein
MNIPNFASLNQSGVLYFDRDSQVAWYFSWAFMPVVNRQNKAANAAKALIFFIMVYY